MQHASIPNSSPEPEGCHRDFNPMVGPDRDDPHPFYADCLESELRFSPTLRAWMVTRHQDLRQVIDDPETYSSRNAIPSVWNNPPEVLRIFADGGFEPEGESVVNTDAPDHAPLRKVLDHAFGGKRIRANHPRMISRANELIDAMIDDGAADLVAQYADPFVQSVISSVFGIPENDVALFQRWSEDLAVVWNPLAPAADKIPAAQGMVEQERYIAAMIEDRRANPREDFLSDMVHGSDDFPPVSYRNTLYMFRGLRIAGHDTTRDTVTSTLLNMLSHRPWWDEVIETPRSISRLAEETIRHDAPHRGLMRITTRDTVLSGVELPAGSALLLLFGAGNRDERVFPEPDTLDPTRANLRDHLAFGTGMHACPGAALARHEVRVAIETLTKRIPTMALKPGWQPTYIPDYFFRGLQELRVTWN